MPPKPKLHKSTGKLHLKSDLKDSVPNSSMQLTPEQEQQFQVELYWCIQQLQTALGSGKLINKQVQDHRKSLNTLMSNSSSIVQKRQVMRLCFGNYREKIAAEEEKASKNITTIKVTPVKPNKKSVFVKKSMSLTHGEHNFKFNFPVPSETEETYIEENKPLQENSSINQENQSYHYIPSNNSFRFNFEVNETVS